MLSKGIDFKLSIFRRILLRDPDPQVLLHQEGPSYTNGGGKVTNFSSSNCLKMRRFSIDDFELLLQ